MKASHHFTIMLYKKEKHRCISNSEGCLIKLTIQVAQCAEQAELMEAAGWFGCEAQVRLSYYCSSQIISPSHNTCLWCNSTLFSSWDVINGERTEAEQADGWRLTAPAPFGTSS